MVESHDNITREAEKPSQRDITIPEPLEVEEPDVKKDADLEKQSDTPHSNVP
jgi:hypothetical protein